MISIFTHRKMLWAVAVLFLATLYIVNSSAKVDAAIAFVQSQSATVNNSTTRTVSLPAVATGGNLIVVVCGAGATSTLSMGTAGYSVAAPSAGTTVSQAIFYKVAVGGEQTVQCNSSVSTRMGAHVYEYSGLQQISPLDGTATANAATGTAVSTGSFTATTASSLVFGAYIAAGGTGYTVTTVGATERSDFRNTIHYGSADRFVTAIGSYSIAATNTASGAWRGQLAVFKGLIGTLAADIVDAGGVPVANPSVSFPNKSFDLGCNPNVTILGISSEKIRITNTTASPAWTLSIGATAGATALWDGGGQNRYDFNDPSIDGCTDGGDADTVAGKLIVDPSVGAIAAQGGCNATGLSLGAETSFAEGTQNSVTLISANGSAQTGCSWDVTGISLRQIIPAEQTEATYSLGLTLTLMAL
jgi:hypothetical protein